MRSLAAGLRPCMFFVRPSAGNQNGQSNHRHFEKAFCRSCHCRRSNNRRDSDVCFRADQTCLRTRHQGGASTDCSEKIGRLAKGTGRICFSAACHFPICRRKGWTPADFNQPSHRFPASSRSPKGHLSFAAKHSVRPRKPPHDQIMRESSSLLGIRPCGVSWSTTPGSI